MAVDQQRECCSVSVSRRADQISVVHHHDSRTIS